MKKFYGRVFELKRLKDLQQKKSASFVVVKGRRRIGKSRLVKEFSKNFDNFYAFTGLPPEAKTTKAHQLDEFSNQLSRLFKIPKIQYQDWSDAFWALGEQVKKGSTLILFDEISWMGSKDPSFLGKVKNLWDNHLSENSNLIFVVCGSASSWIEKNMLSSSGFVGRISLTLTLQELPINDCRDFFLKSIAPYEMLKLLSVTGGVPKYLEEIIKQKTAEENISNLCFTDGGFLVHEFERIFSDIFLRSSDYYRNIIRALSNGPLEQIQICDALGIARNGRVSEYLSELETAGFIAQDYSWNLRNASDSNMKQYRLSDNYLRFYLKYIEPNFSKIQRGTFRFKSCATLPGWNTIMGFQFENLCLNNRLLLQKAANIRLEEIECENPYFQRKTTSQEGCQIDYMVQTKFQTLYIFEIKFSKQPIGASVIEEVKEKIRKLKKPKSFSCRPILVHVNGVTDELEDADYFSEIIDFSYFLSSTE